jgi:uncharacterized repeat protein (TIGR01451 family)
MGGMPSMPPASPQVVVPAGQADVGMPVVPTAGVMIGGSGQVTTLPAPQTPRQTPPSVPPTELPGSGIGKLQQPLAPAKQVAPQEVSAASVSSDNPTGRQEPAVSLEWIGPVTARLNQPTAYQIIAKNISNGAVHNVVIRYRVPTGVRLAGAEPRAVNEGGMLIWDLATLMPTQEKRIDLQIVPESKIGIECQATVTFSGMSTFKVQVREPKLVVKATAPEKAVLGDPAAFSLTVSNPGDGMADHVKLKTLLSDGLEHSRGKQIELDIGSLAAGENRTVQIVCNTTLPGKQSVDCVALADAGLNSQDVAFTDVVSPRLDLSVAGPKLRYLERHATYTLKVTNPGSSTANNVSIVYNMPQGFKFASATGGGRHDFSARTVSWFVGDLAAGESREVTLDEVAINIGEHRHTASATAARGLKTEGEVMTRVEGLSALLMELVDTDDPIEVGSETSYEIRVTNTGSKTETNLELVCTIPEKMEFRGAKCAAGCTYKVEGRDVIFQVLPRLAPRADVIYRVVVKGIAPGDMRFRARIRADGLTEPVLREESTRVYGDDPPH